MNAPSQKKSSLKTNSSEDLAYQEDRSVSYFKGLNYTLANEDTEFELALTKHYKPQNILSVCGSGGRSLPFLSQSGVKKLTLVDLSEIQLDFARVKYVTMARCSYEEYLLFWGFAPFLPEENKEYRKSLFNDLKLEDRLKTTFESLFKIYDDEGLIYKGQWEQRYTIAPKILRRILSDKITRHYDKLFSFEELSEQLVFVEEVLKNPIWKALPKAVIFAFGNARYFNAMLYHGAMMKKNIPESSYDFYLGAFRQILTQTVARRNFFLQLSIFGKIIYKEANTPEAQRNVFDACKANQAQVDTAFLKTPIIPDMSMIDDQSQLLVQRGPYDFVSLSDVPSYFKGNLEVSYLQLLKKILAPGAVVVSRCYLRIPEGTQTHEFEDISPQWNHEMVSEKTQMYKIFVYQYRPKSN